MVQKKTVNLNDNSETIEAYTYSPAGNISSANGDDSFVYDTNNRLTEFDDQSISYDADGNMVSSSLGSFGYDCFNRLVNDGVCNYIYNVEGTRMSVFNWTTYRVVTYTYDVNARLSRLLTVTDNGVTTKYVYGLGLISEETGTDCKVYHYDYRGSTVALTDISGNVTDRFAYDTYGKLISHTGTSYTPFLYNGRDGVISDKDTSLIYMRTRFYSPELRRFINADVLHGDIINALTLNRYAYCNGDPVNGIDPMGLSQERGSIADSLYSWFNSAVDFLKKSWESAVKKRKNKYSKINAKYEVYDTITEQYKWAQYVPVVNGIANTRFEMAFSAIDKYKDTIMQVSEEYNVPAEIIASIILKEQYTQSIPDFAANIHTLIFDKPHSVGLGAIFPDTAKSAWEDIKGIDYNDYGYYDMQMLLMNEEFNIETIAVVLLYENEGPDTSNADWHELLEAYNGSSRYADYVSEYLVDMKEYLSYD